MLLDNDDDDFENPSHLSILEGGIEAWNKWRADNPNVMPDLRGVDFTDRSFAASALWDKRRQKVSLSRANLSGTSLDSAELTGIDLQLADLTGANLENAHLERADLRRAKLQGAELSGADLREADFLAADLTSASLVGARLEGANLRRANMTDTDVTSVEYTVRGLSGKCRGIRAEACHGNATFRREVMDQDYLDQMEAQVIAAFAHKGSRAKAILDGFTRPLPPIAGTLLSLPAALQLTKGAIPMFSALLRGDFSDFDFSTFGIFISIVLGAVIFASFMGSTYGRVIAYRIWGLFSFGRRWDVVVFFAGGMIMLFSFLYMILSPDHVILSEVGQDKIAFFPLFVAVMGFCTLGVTDLATPVTDLGAVVMIGNVLSGFVTLGLLLSVLGNVFARRS
ncbi:pentapeptide repeat-containing protein [Parvularcula marina]|uniref:pentapeptide repeat-containing protein n=1 Tax=Parvularcula marina TaxID=2292771 RepID=UPI003518E508